MPLQSGTDMMFRVRVAVKMDRQRCGNALQATRQGFAGGPSPLLCNFREPPARISGPHQRMLISFWVGMRHPAPVE